MLTKLPDEIILHVALNLDYGDLLTLRSVCKQLGLTLDSYWDAVCIQTWGSAWDRFHLDPPNVGLDHVLETSHRKFWIMKRLAIPSLALMTQLSPQDLPVLMELLRQTDPWLSPPYSVVRHGYIEMMIQALCLERGLALLQEGLMLSLWYGIDMIFNRNYHEAVTTLDLAESLHKNVYLKYMFPYVKGSKCTLHFPLEIVYLQTVLRAIKVVVRKVFRGLKSNAFDEIDRYCLLKVYEGRAPAASELAMAIVYEHLLRFFESCSMAVESVPIKFEAEVAGIFLKVGEGYFYLRPCLQAASRGLPYYGVEAFTYEEVCRFLRSRLSIGGVQIQAYLRPMAPESIYSLVQLASSLNQEIKFSQYILKLVKLGHVQETGVALFQRHSKLQEYLNKFGAFAIYLPVIHRSLLDDKSQLLSRYFESIESLKMYRLPDFNVDLALVAMNLNKTHHVTPIGEARSVEVISTGEPAMVLGEVQGRHWLVYSPMSAYMILANDSVQPCKYSPEQVAKMGSCQPALFYPNAFSI